MLEGAFPIRSRQGRRDRRRPGRFARGLSAVLGGALLAVAADSSVGGEARGGVPAIVAQDVLHGASSRASASPNASASLEPSLESPPADDDGVELTGPPRPGAEVDPDLQFLRSILQNPANAPDVRQGAAQRIVARGSTDAMRIIDEALRSGDPGQVDAVATAIDGDNRRPGTMLDALMTALATAPRELHPKIARLLSREGELAAERVALVAVDASKPASERLGAIYAMGQLRGRDQLPDLILLLDEKRREPPEVVREACGALERATNQQLGANPEAWRQWWAARRSTPSTEFLVAQLREQVAQLQKQVQLEGERTTKLVARLRQAYFDTLVALPPAERAERIGLLFDDELPEVRNLAIGQVERMLRNGERPPDLLVARVTERLTDRAPVIRQRAVRALDDLAVPKLSERVAEILPAESDAATAEVMLRLLGARPVAAGFGPAAARLGEPALGEAAATAVNRIVDAGLARPGWEAEVIAPVRSAVAAKATPELVRLLAAAGSESDRDAVVRFLESDDDALRAGAAEGLRRAGRRRPLVERAAADPVIYPIALSAIADQAPSAAVVASLFELPPKPSEAEAWNAAMTRVIAGLPSKEILATDARLASLPFVSAKTRITGLRAALAAPANGNDGPKPEGTPATNGSTPRVDVVARLAELLIVSGDAKAALGLLTSDGQRDASLLKPLYFRAAVLEGEYETAAKVEPGAAAWLALLESLVRQAPRAARPLAIEIGARFGDTLSSAEREKLAALERTLLTTGEG